MAINSYSRIVLLLVLCGHFCEEPLAAQNSWIYSSLTGDPGTRPRASAIDPTTGNIYIVRSAGSVLHLGKFNPQGVPLFTRSEIFTHEVSGLHVDRMGNAYVVGEGSGTPVTANAYQTQRPPGNSYSALSGRWLRMDRRFIGLFLAEPTHGRPLLQPIPVGA
jgi:hypothetical protein